MRSGVASRIVFAAYLVLLMLPIYWLIILSLRKNEDIMSGLVFYPHHPTIEKYVAIFNNRPGCTPLAYRCPTSR
jgi:glycerol transport system permease protein